MLSVGCVVMRIDIMSINKASVTGTINTRHSAISAPLSFPLEKSTSIKPNKQNTSNNARITAIIFLNTSNPPGII